MLAKFGLTSPFGKRKHKEQQTTTIAVTTPTTKQIVSNLQTPKKLFYSSIPSPASVLCQQDAEKACTHTSLLNKLKQQSSAKQENELVANSESSSGVSSSSNKTASNSSRSTSPSNSYDSHLITSNVCTISNTDCFIDKSSTKAAFIMNKYNPNMQQHNQNSQQQQSDTKDKRESKKSGLPKIVSKLAQPSVVHHSTLSVNLNAQQIASDVNSSKSLQPSSVPQLQQNSQQQFGFNLNSNNEPASLKSTKKYGMNSTSSNRSNQTYMQQNFNPTANMPVRPVSNVTSMASSTFSTSAKDTLLSSSSSSSIVAKPNSGTLKKPTVHTNSIPKLAKPSPSLQLPTAIPTPNQSSLPITKKLEKSSSSTKHAQQLSANANDVGTLTRLKKTDSNSKLVSTKTKLSNSTCQQKKQNESLKTSPIKQQESSETTKIPRASLCNYEIEYSSSQSSMDTVTQHQVQHDQNLIINLSMDTTRPNEMGKVDLELNDENIFESKMDQMSFTRTNDLSKCARNLQKHFKDRNYQMGLKENQHKSESQNQELDSSKFKQQQVEQMKKANSKLNSPRQQSENGSVQSPLMLELPVYSIQKAKTNQCSPNLTAMQSAHQAPMHKFYSSSLERSNRYSQQSFNSDNPHISHKASRFTASNQKRPLSQDTILENPNILFSTNSNDDILKFKNEAKIANTHMDLSQMSVQDQLLAKENEVKILQKDLEAATSHITILKNQLNSNSNIVNTLEHNLSTLTIKFQSLSVNAQRKDKLINELRTYLDLLGNKYPKVFENEKLTSLIRHNSTESMTSLNSIYSQRSFQSTSEVDTSPLGFKKKRNWFRSSFIKAFNRKATADCKKSELDMDFEITSPISQQEQTKTRYSDADEKTFTSLLNSQFLLSASASHQQFASTNTQGSKIQNGQDFETIQRQLREKENKLTDIRLEALASAHQLEQLKDEFLRMKIEMNSLKDENSRLKAFVNLRNTNSINDISKSFNESSNSSSNSSQSSPSSKSSTSGIGSLTKSDLNFADIIDTSSKPDVLESRIGMSPRHTNYAEVDGKTVNIFVYFGEKDQIDNIMKDSENQTLIGKTTLSTKTNWDTMDKLIKHKFKNYLDESDDLQQINLGLGVDSIDKYYVGDMLRICRDHETRHQPDFLPYGYLVGTFTSIIIQLSNQVDHKQSSIDLLCYETLIPKTILQRYISLLNEHRNLLFCGQNGTFKTFLAQKLAEYLAKVHKKVSNANTKCISYFNVENKTNKDIQEYLNSIIESDTTFVVILDNLHFVSNVAETFNQYFSNQNSSKCEFLIGTINQPNVTSLNLHPNFKWVLYANHTEPVRSYLNRYYQRKLKQYEIENQVDQDLRMTVDWIPRLWQHINKYIETYNSADVTMGPKQFASMPMDVNAAKIWFIDLWNNILAPHLIETVLEGVQAFDCRIPWNNPKNWIIETSPWKFSDKEKEKIFSISSNDVCCFSEIDDDALLLPPPPPPLSPPIQNESSSNRILKKSLSSYDRNSFTQNHVSTGRNDNGDKLITMLMKLQECTVNLEETRSNNNSLNSTFNNRNNSTRILNNHNFMPTSIPKSVESTF